MGVSGAGQEVPGCVADRFSTKTPGQYTVHGYIGLESGFPQLL